MDKYTKEYIKFASILNALLVLLVALFFICSKSEATIDLDAIKTIESNGRNVASTIKSEGAIGVYQITPILLIEFNNYHPAKQYTSQDLWDVKINEEIASWYLNKRIPQMIKHYGKPVTTDNVLTAYNAGINYVKTGKEIPQITKRYIEKYNKLTGK